MARTETGGTPKHRQVYRALEREIQAGRWKDGDRLPSEADLVRQFGASRITVGRAVRDLQRAGLVERRAGSGTFVRPQTRRRAALSFGLLIPDLGETEIFEPICQGMMASPLAREHALVWGSVTGRAPAPRRKSAPGSSAGSTSTARCPACSSRRSSSLRPRTRSTLRIAQALDDARIPVVLLDRTVLPYPQRGHHDLVGIDNRRAATSSPSTSCGSARAASRSSASANAAATVDAREAGYREALYAAGTSPTIAGAACAASTRRMRPPCAAFMESARPEAIVCANDWTAARLMRTLLELGYAVPGRRAPRRHRRRGVRERCCPCR